MSKPVELIQALRAIPWFVELKPYHLERLSSIAKFRTIDIDDKLFREGDQIDDVFILLEGQIALEIYVPTFGELRIFTAEPLDIIGWDSMTPVVRQRTSDARAIKPTRLVAFNGDEMRKLCEEDRDLGYVIMRRVSNVVASRLLTTRLQLYELIMHASRDGIVS